MGLVQPHSFRVASIQVALRRICEVQYNLFRSGTERTGQRQGLRAASTRAVDSPPLLVVAQTGPIHCRMLLWRDVCLHCVVGVNVLTGGEGSRHFEQLNQSSVLPRSFPLLADHFIHIRYVEQCYACKFLSIKLLSPLSVGHLEK